MPMMQAYNPRNKRYVKYHFTKEGLEITAQKKTPFKGVPFKNKKKV